MSQDERSEVIDNVIEVRNPTDIADRVTFLRRENGSAVYRLLPVHTV